MRPLRVANAHGFWGDRLVAAAELLQLEPDLDFLTLDFLAEVSMSILASQRDRDPKLGYAKDFVEVVRSLTPYWKAGGRCRVITNAGGLSPYECGLACHEVLKAAGCEGKSIAVVFGDDVLGLVRSGHSAFKNLDTGEPIAPLIDQLMTANAYLGASCLLEALEGGADLIITGRVADPSLTVAPCIHHFGWSPQDYDRIAGATVAGHLIECGVQVCGGISTDWLDTPSLETIGFPIVEIADDGSCVVTKPRGSGGRVTEATVKEQLVYEIGDPARYLSPDATVSFQSLETVEAGPNRVQVRGAVGSPPPPTYKVSATYRKGFWAAGSLVICGSETVNKAQQAAEMVRRQLADQQSLPAQFVPELLGAGGSGLFQAPASYQTDHDPPELVLRIAVADERREIVETFTRAMTPLITAGPSGTTGYAEGRPRVHPRIGYWPCLLDRETVQGELQWIGDGPKPSLTLSPAIDQAAQAEPSPVQPKQPSKQPPQPPRRRSPTLADFAYARSGDKGRNANIGVIARVTEEYLALGDFLTIERVARYFGLPVEAVERYELPQLQAFNFVLAGILENNLRTDAQGKALAQWLLRTPCKSLSGEA